MTSGDEANRIGHYLAGAIGWSLLQCLPVENSREVLSFTPSPIGFRGGSRSRPRTSPLNGASEGNGRPMVVGRAIIAWGEASPFVWRPANRSTRSAKHNGCRDGSIDSRLSEIDHAVPWRPNQKYKPKITRTVEPITMNKPSIVLLHGAWHNATCWSPVITSLVSAGHRVYAPDLPGAGVNAKYPASYRLRPFDPAAFASEPSPSAHIRQGERTDAIVSLVERAVRESGRQAVLVGHSLGGITVTSVTEAIPGKIAAAVYLTGLLLPPHLTTFEFLSNSVMAGSRATELMVAEPQIVGACRINPLCPTSSYRALLKETFAGDVPESDFDKIAHHLHCDESAQIFNHATIATPSRFGVVQRHYIRCLEDRCLFTEAQDFMISAADEAFGTATCVYDLPTSHSPFLSGPDALARHLIEIAALSEREP